MNCSPKYNLGLPFKTLASVLSSLQPCSNLRGFVLQCVQAIAPVLRLHSDQAALNCLDWCPELCVMDKTAVSEHRLNKAIASYSSLIVSHFEIHYFFCWRNQNYLMHLYFGRTYLNIRSNAGEQDIYRTLEFPDWTVALLGWMILTFVPPHNIISDTTTISLILYHI